MIDEVETATVVVMIIFEMIEVMIMLKMTTVDSRKTVMTVEAVISKAAIVVMMKVMMVAVIKTLKLIEAMIVSTMMTVDS